MSGKRLSLPYNNNFNEHRDPHCSSLSNITTSDDPGTEAWNAMRSEEILNRGSVYTHVLIVWTCGWRMTSTHLKRAQASMNNLPVSLLRVPSVPSAGACLLCYSPAAEAVR